MLKRFASVILALALCLTAVSAVLAEENAVVLSEDFIFDHMKGGWVGQMAGVTWSAPTEFYASRQNKPEIGILPEDIIPEWIPETINDGFAQDDLYVDVTFLDCIKDNGANADWTVFGEYFGNSQYRLWHANRWGRDNIRAGTPAPWSGHYTNSLHCDDIDWQIECDAVGMSALAQPEVAKEIAWRAGHVMNYGDGVYGGVYVATMYASAFTADSVDGIIQTGMNAIPQESQFWQVQNDVLECYKAGKTWEEAWHMLDEKWTNDRCPSGLYKQSFNIDAKMNSAYITIGLLYGEGDFEKSMYIAMRCGQDSDCNPASVGGILGCFYGYEALDSKWSSALDWDTLKFEYTEYTFNDCINVNLEAAKSIVELRGGKVENGEWTIPVSDQENALILEQWPKDINPMPEFKYAVAASDGMTVHFDASATDANGIAGYQWFFGDLTFESGASVSHTYLNPGAYIATCYVTDTLGNTSWQQVTVLAYE